MFTGLKRIISSKCKDIKGKNLTKDLHLGNIEKKENSSFNNSNYKMIGTFTSQMISKHLEKTFSQQGNAN